MKLTQFRFTFSYNREKTFLKKILKARSINQDELYRAVLWQCIHLSFSFKEIHKHFKSCKEFKKIVL